MSALAWTVIGVAAFLAGTAAMILLARKIREDRRESK